MHFRVRTIVLSLQFLLVAGSGGVVAGLAFMMENRQVAEDAQNRLAMVSDAITRETEAALTQVELRANVFGILTNKKLLDLGDTVKLVNIFSEIIKRNELICGISFIDDATGNSIHVGNKPNGEIYHKNTVFDPVKKTFTSQVIEEGDLAKIGQKPLLENTSDPRKFPIYIAFKDNGPGWTPAHFSEIIPQGIPEPVASYIFPIRTDNKTLRGIFVVNMGIKEVGKYLQGKGNQIGFNGEAVALERNLEGKILVLGYEGKNSIALVENKEKLGELYPDARVRAVTRHIHLEEQKGGNPFASQKSSFAKIEDANGKKSWCAWSVIFPGRQPDWIIVSMENEDLIFADSRWRLNRFFNFLLVILVLLLPLGYLLARSWTKPLEALSLDAERVGRMEIQNQPLQWNLALELQRLSQSMLEMKAGLLSFKKFVPGDIVKQVVRSGKTAVPGGKKQTLTILFTDLVSFTSLGEKLNTQDLVSLVGDHLAMCSRIIHNHGGTIDKFIGDSVMAFWNAPEDCPNHAQQAAAAAIDIQKELLNFNLLNKEKGLPPLAMRIGINTGEALVGNIGTNERLNYTALGDTVNLASRLEGANKFYATSILVSNCTASLVSKEILLRPVDCVSVKGKHEGHLIHELLDFSKGPSPEAVKKAALTQQAWNYYQKKEWEEAARAYGELRSAFPDDGLAKVMGDRCQEYMRQPPPPDWSGVFHLDEK